MNEIVLLVDVMRFQLTKSEVNLLQYYLECQLQDKNPHHEAKVFAQELLDKLRGYDGWSKY